ncbi:bacteriohopanetetrol glucosamine biosynthesis glycosyltransferase HpnI [uncultured Paludibaculum sp.]|uniref:bacteriohopanetetrol glucosamine biosynthesis glycosyltransferase HpnI n=1 Tax=uncultured Paludibaculum sp. TaxID=1765020 RepID=UPI002AAAC9D3|nr:bacteriohopanetetrol glucosamine biosynthesis glycosyltransferase HpnI [uncultured Paludibaculum sp.]
MSWIPTIVLGCLLAGSWVFCILTVIAAIRYRRVRPPALLTCEPISILKPLHHLDDGLEENLRSFFEQDYPDFELLFAAREASDPALALVERLRLDYPHIPVRIFVTGEPPYPNAKVWSLQLMMVEAEHDLLVMSDSDIRVTHSMLRTLAAEFQDQKLGVATCPYRAVPGQSVWSALEAIGMNTEFWGGAITARMVEGGVKFAVGPTIAARREVVRAVGGWERLSKYLAEDFVLGQFAAAAGYGVILSSYVIEHRIGAQTLASNFAHRLRWSRSTRRSRPAGYVGQVFTNPVPIAMALLVLQPATWPAALVTCVLRAMAAAAISEGVLHDPLCRMWWPLILWQDLLSFAFWVAGFFGNTIVWRGRRYRLLTDGRFELIGYRTIDRPSR